MQLHQAEHRDIMDRLHQRGLTNSVRFVKRKGWVFIEMNGSSFAFHRKKVTRLENGRFTDALEYYTNYPQKPVKVAGWQEVLARFDAWLQSSGS